MILRTFHTSIYKKKIKGPRNIKAFQQQETEKRRAGGYYMLLRVYTRSLFREFETYLRIVVGLVEDDIQLFFLKKYISKIVTYEIPSGIYSFKDTSEVVRTMGDHEGTLQIKNDDISMNKKPYKTLFDGTFGTLRSDEESFFITSPEFTSYWD